MASDPSQLIAHLLDAGGITGASFAQGQQNYNANQQAQQNLQLGAQNLQLGQQQIASNQSAQAEDARYQADLANYVSDPTPQAMSNMIVMHPAKYQALKQSWDVKNDAERRADLGFWGGVNGTLGTGDNGGAAQLIHQRLSAERAIGIANPAEQEMADKIDAGDPDAIKSVRAYALAQIASATGPDKFAETMKTVKGGYDLNAGQSRYDDNNKLLATGPTAEKAETPEYQLDPSTHQWVMKPFSAGGTPSPSGTPGPATGAPTAGRTQYGWTPRARNGGDNTDAAVDSKLSGMEGALGIARHDPFPAGMSNMQIAQSLSLSEGGAGSIADRNNNPGNLTDPSTGKYRSFPTKAAGMNAAAAQVARNRARGQNSISSMVEGLPIGGGTRPAQSSGTPGGPFNGYPSTVPVGSPDAPTTQIVEGDISTVPAPIRATVQAIADGRAAAPRPGTRNGEALLDAVTAYDHTFDAANATSRVKTRNDFTSGKSAQAVNSLNTSMGHLFHLDDQVDTLGNAGYLSGLLNAPRRAIQTGVMNNTAYTTFDQTKTAAASEMRKVFSNSNGGTLPELQAWESSIDSANSPDQLHAAIRNGVILMGSRLDALKDQYTNGMGRSDKVPQFIKPMIVDAARHRFGIDLGNSKPAQPPAPQLAAPQASRFRILSVRPK